MPDVVVVILKAVGRAVPGLWHDDVVMLDLHDDLVRRMAGAVVLHDDDQDDVVMVAVWQDDVVVVVILDRQNHRVIRLYDDQDAAVVVHVLHHQDHHGRGGRTRPAPPFYVANRADAPAPSVLISGSLHNSGQTQTL